MSCIWGQENWVQAQTLPHFPVMTEKSLDVSGIHLKHESFELNFIPWSAFWLCSFVILHVCHSMYKASLGPGSMSLNPFFMWNLILSVSSWDFPECPYPLSRFNCSSVTGPLSYCSHLPSVSSVDYKPLVGGDLSLLFPCLLPQTVHTFVEIFVLLTV